MNQKKQNNGGRGCLFLVIGTVLILALMALYIFAVGRITASVIEARSGDTPAYAVMSAQVPCIIAAFVLLECVLVLQYLPSQEDYDRQKPLGGEKSTRRGILGSGRFANLLSVILLALLLLCGAVSVNTYRMVSENGISVRFFRQTAAYTWDDVSQCRVDCDSDKGLSVTFTMTDGKEFEILQNTISDNAAFAARYAPDATDNRTAVLAFAADLCRQLDERNVRRIVSHSERAIRFYQTGYPEQWVYVRELIRYEEIRPSDDETVPATETVKPEP